MERRDKIILIVAGSVLLATAIGVAIYKLTRDDEDEGTGEQTPSTAGVTQKTPKPQAETDRQEQAPVPKPVVQAPVDPTMVSPRFNVENELENPMAELKNQILYPKRTAQGGAGYANVRSSTEVNTDQGWWDPTDNLITTISSGTQIGRVVSHETKVYNGYNYRWFKVKLSKPVAGYFSDYTEGYVRADTVTFKPYKR